MNKTFLKYGWRPTCDLDVNSGLVMSCDVFCLHRNLVDPRLFIAVLDWLIRHSQVLVNSSNPITEVHLILGAARVALLRRINNFKQTLLQHYMKK